MHVQHAEHRTITINHCTSPVRVQPHCRMWRHLVQHATSCPEHIVVHDCGRRKRLRQPGEPLLRRGRRGRSHRQYGSREAQHRARPTRPLSPPPPPHSQPRAPHSQPRALRHTYCAVQHHVPIDPYAERMPRADCSSNTIRDSISRVAPSLRGPRFAPALRHARRPCALTRGRPAVPRQPGTGRSRRTARRAALAPAVLR